MHQFSIVLDDEVFKGLCDMAKVARRKHQEQAAVLVEREYRRWNDRGRIPSEATSDTSPETVAA